MTNNKITISFNKSYFSYIVILILILVAFFIGSSQIFQEQAFPQVNNLNNNQTYTPSPTTKIIYPSKTPFPTEDIAKKTKIDELNRIDNRIAQIRNQLPKIISDASDNINKCYENILKNNGSKSSYELCISASKMLSDSLSEELTKLEQQRITIISGL